MAIEKLVSLAGLGLCEHCGVLISIDGLPADSIDADWICACCGKVLSHLSFGYESSEEESSGFKKVKWVGPDGQWVLEEPVRDFNLGNWSVQVEPIRYPFQ